MKAELRQVIINTANLDSLVAFWAGLLSVGVKEEMDGYTWLNPDREGGVSVGFQEVDDDPESPNRIHIDILVDDLAEATDRVTKLGGTLISEHLMNNIVADPDGNEFCVYEDSE